MRNQHSSGVARRVEQARRRAAKQLTELGVAVELHSIALELIQADSPDATIVFGEPEGFRQAALDLLERYVDRGWDPRRAQRELNGLRVALGLPVQTDEDVCPEGTSVLVSLGDRQELLDGLVIGSSRQCRRVVTDIPLDPRSLRSARMSLMFECPGRHIGGCDAEILESHRLDGATYWKIALPADTIDENRRSNWRVPLKIAGRIMVSRNEVAYVEDAEWVEENGFLPAFLLDMSSGGVKLRLTTNVQKGDQVWLVVGRSDRREEIELSGHVVWCTRVGSGPVHLAGVSFDAVSPEIAAQLRSFLASMSQDAPTDPSSATLEDGAF